MPINIIYDCRTSTIPREAILKLAKRIYRAEKIPKKKSVNVIFCGNSKIMNLNKLYRKKDYPTDVLSFEFHEKDFLGEIYISLPKARSQAKELRHSLSDEINRLFVHGMVHLLGYDHEASTKERKVMERIESKYIRL